MECDQNNQLLFNNSACICQWMLINFFIDEKETYSNKCGYTESSWEIHRRYMSATMRFKGERERKRYMW